ncbi:MAG: recombination-associated protein RdgC [Deltaproteobacteria bacterium]|jgi:DNA recombination-dependent growth factor C|nr:recombination-associated protein RdgC [Deltaproteobacteria bacterium]
MAFLAGLPTISRYRLLDSPKELTDEFVQSKLTKNAFVDIERLAEEESLGWVEIFNPLNTAFTPESFNFGGFLAFQARLDSRRLSGKTLRRYYLLKEAEVIAQTGRKPSSQKKRELMGSLKQDLLRRALLNTDLLEIIWFPTVREIWIGGAGEKKRLIFEELWEKSFGLPVRLLVPITLGFEMIPQELGEALLKAQASDLWGEDE